MIFYLSCHKNEDLKKCGELVDRGGIIIFPTDTVYGIGCDPFNDASALNLFKIKNRPLNKFFPILTNEVSNLTPYARITDEAKILIENFWPGQLTIILKVQNDVPFSKHIFDKSIAFRIPNNECTLKLIQCTKKKLLIGTSANLSGQPPIANIDLLKNSGITGYDAVITSEIEYVLDVESRLKNKNTIDTSHNQLNIINSITRSANMTNISDQTSTIVDIVEPNKPKIQREGVIPKEQIFEVLARKV